MNNYGLIGYPLSHSFSENYFAEKFQKEQIQDCSYKAYPISSIEDVIPLISKENLSGFNVTIPYKKQIIPFLDSLSEEADRVQAVNTVKVVGDKLIGYNTDIYGFQTSIKPFLASYHERALILGTGGASAAVAYVLKQLGIQVFFVSRSNLDIENGFTYEQLSSEMMAHFKLIVNTTPLGTYPDVDSFPPLPYKGISSEHLLYDLVYNPSETSFMKKGKSQGAVAINGMNMLKLQAERAWEIWRG
jgi:shikimate dehydrogenase